MNIRTVYRNAMRAATGWRSSPALGPPPWQPCPLVRLITGVGHPGWPPGGLNNWSTQFARRPGIRWVWRYNDFWRIGLPGAIVLPLASCRSTAA